MEGKYEKPTSVIITYFSNIKVNKKLDKNANEYLAKSIMFCKQKWLLLKGTWIREQSILVMEGTLAKAQCWSYHKVELECQ